MAATYATALVAVLALLTAITAQASDAALVQCNTFNSSYKLTSSQIKNAELDKSSVQIIQVGLNFERSNWAGQSVNQQFYEVPANTSSLPPGSLLKIEQYTNTSLYTIAPQLSLSRFLFQSETLNGTSVPASAYILWPYTARRFAGIDGVPTIAWAHGNSGYYSECAPSHIRNLWYQYSAPYELALAGYAVVAPDYAGLGVSKDAAGKPILSQWQASPAAANDLFHAVQAARKGWPELSKEFVVMGHSQGGGAAWGAAQRQHKTPVDGYLGTIAGSPLTSIRALIDTFPDAASFLSLGFGYFFKTIFPSFEPSELLNARGLKRLRVMTELQTCSSSNTGFYTETVNKPGWDKTWYVEAFNRITRNGGQRFKGPLLVLQGIDDPQVNVNTTTAAVRETCAKFPDQSLHYMRFQGAEHVSTLFSSRMVWMDWIADRFNGVKVPAGCYNETVVPLRKVSSYQPTDNFFLEYAQYPSYELGGV